MSPSHSSIRFPILAIRRRAAHQSVLAAFRPLHALMASPVLLFMATLTAMLFRPSDLQFYDLDRIAFVLLVVVVVLRALVLRQPLRPAGMVTWPMLGLTALAVASALVQPYQSEAWSVLAAKWIVPSAMYYMARLIFEDEASLRRFEVFMLVVLAYLTAIAILFLLGMKSLILPPFIVDESIGIHADRARGPFLQAVANGVTLNLLGLIALDSYRRRRLRGVLALLFLIALPLAILETKTRAVWLSFAASVLALLYFSPSQRVRRACLCLALAGVVGLLGALTFEDVNQSITARFEERSPVEFRMAVYRAGWDMFRAKPLLGWGAAQMQAGLERRISEFHQEEFFVHNTFLEIAVDYGLLGIVLYAWMVLDLFRLGKKSSASTVPRDGIFLDRGFRSFWPVLIGVYLLNACFVVMNYQFVNGLLFTLAGILAAQNRSSKSPVESA
jgi:putative inorganic carbon (HCO3(-)) transporter